MHRHNRSGVRLTAVKWTKITFIDYSIYFERALRAFHNQKKNVIEYNCFVLLRNEVYIRKMCDNCTSMYRFFLFRGAFSLSILWNGIWFRLNVKFDWFVVTVSENWLNPIKTQLPNKLDIEFHAKDNRFWFALKLHNEARTETYNEQKNGSQYITKKKQSFTASH